MLEGYERINGLSTKQLEDISEQLDGIKKKIDFARKQRITVIEQVENEEMWKLNEKVEPYIYYHMRHQEQEIAIITTCTTYDKDFHQYTRHKRLYSIELTKWIPKYLEYEKCIRDRPVNHIGRFETLEQAKVYYYKFMREILEEYLPVMQEELIKELTK